MNHRDEALRLLSAAKDYAVHSPARASLLAEAQIHALLAVAEPAPAIALVEEAPKPPAARRRAPKKPTEAAE